MMGPFTSDLDSENNPRPYPSPFQVVATVGNCNDNNYISFYYCVIFSDEGT